MGEFDLAYWLFEPKVWIILGIVLIIADVFLGYTFFVLPIGVAALLIAGLIFAQGKLWFGDTVIFETWHDVGLWFAVLSVVSIGLLKMLARRWIKDQPDINEY
ncbi:MAG: hypothetical protein KDE22_11080 [Rhodobacterales bacterium]|nr:hypothetical protein [Rhodobacterales bacterium]